MNNVLLQRLSLVTFFAFFPMTARGQWTEMSTGMVKGGIRTIMADDPIVFTGTDSGEVLRSTDNGDTWTVCKNGPPPEWINSFARNEKYVFLASNSGLYRSDNNGDSWDVIDPGDGVHGMWPLCADGATVVAGGYPGSVCISTDSGRTWNAVDSSQFSGAGFGGSIYVQSLFIYGSRLFAGFCEGGLFTAPVSGMPWTRVQVDSLERCTPMSFTAIGSTLYLASIFNGDGIYSSADSGNTWTSVGLESGIWQIAQGGGTLFAIYGNNSGVYYSVENTANWSRSDVGGYLALAATPTWVFAGGSDGAVWRAPVSGFTPVRKPRKRVGGGGTMGLQVNKNGNAVVSITFSLHSSQNAEVAVFNLSGACVATLFSGIAAAGPHRVSWDARSAPGGRYLVTLRGESGESVRSVLLVR